MAVLGGAWAAAVPLLILVALYGYGHLTRRLHWTYLAYVALLVILAAATGYSLACDPPSLTVPMAAAATLVVARGIEPEARGVLRRGDVARERSGLVHGSVVKLGQVVTHDLHRAGDVRADG